MNYPDWDPRAKASQYADWDPRSKAHEAAGFGALAGDIGSAIGEFPTQAMGSIGRIMEGIDSEDIFLRKNIYDDWIREAKELTQARMREPGQERPYFESMPEFTRGSLGGLPASIAMSGVTMGTALATGVAAGAAGTAAAGPVGGFIAGRGTALGVSGKLTFNYAGNIFVRTAVGMANESFREENDRDMTPEEKMVLSEKFLPFAKRSGLWNAIPEAASNIIGFQILSSPLKKLFGEKVLTRFLGKIGALYGEETLTETITGIGELGPEIDANLTDEERRSFAELQDWWKTAKEVFPTVAIQTTLTAGLVGGGIQTVKAATGDRPSAAEEEKTVRDQIELNRRIQPAPDVETAAAESAAIQDEVWAETAEPTIPEEPIVEPVKKEELTGRERIAQRKEEIDQASQEAAPAVESEEPAPTPAQIEAGNYKKGHTRLHGFDISIENPKGSIRRSLPDAEHQWEQEMAHDYGYLRGTVGRDKDHLDVFLGDNAADETLPVFVVDQVIDGKFDENKVIFGAATEQEARDIYLANYEEGWQGLGAITEMSPEVFKEWSRDSVATQKEAAEYETVVEPPAERLPAEKPKPETRPIEPKAELLPTVPAQAPPIPKLDRQIDIEGIRYRGPKRDFSTIEDAAFWDSLHGFSDADKRYDILRKRGATDNELSDVLKRELGSGGASYPGEGWGVRGGTKWWYGTTTSGKPLLSGKALVRKARELLDIPQKEEKPSARKISEDQEKPKKPRQKRPRGKEDRRRDVQQKPKARAKARDQEEAHKQRVIAAAQRVNKGVGRTVIGEMRERTKLSREDFDDAILSLADEGKVALYPMEHPEELRRRPDAKQGAITVHGEQLHVAYFDEAPKAQTLRERPKAVDKFLANLPKTKEMAIEVDEKGEEHMIELTHIKEQTKYNALNKRIEALERVLDCIG